MKYIKFLTLLFAACCLLSSFCVNVSLAQDTLLPGGGGTSADQCRVGCSSGDEQCKQYCGDYGVSDFVIIFIRASNLILGISGSLALLAFIYGGVMFLISAGNSQRIDRAKTIIFGAVIGLFVVFGSYAIISLVFKALGLEAGWSKTGWF